MLWRKFLCLILRVESCSTPNDILSRRTTRSSVVLNQIIVANDVCQDGHDAHQFVPQMKNVRENIELPKDTKVGVDCGYSDGINIKFAEDARQNEKRGIKRSVSSEKMHRRTGDWKHQAEFGIQGIFAQRLAGNKN